MARPQHQQYLGALLTLLAATYVACSGYDGSNRVSKPPQLIPDLDYGGAPAVTAGAGPGGSATSAGAAGTATGAAGAPSAGAAGSSSDGGAASGGAPSGGAPSGGAAPVAGSGGAAAVAGSGGAPSGGSAGAGLAGAVGSAGGTAVEQLLSQGKSATADSEETGHLAALGNDGAADTRWCAANGAAGHYWQVDLGKTYVLSKLGVTWEKAVVYQFKVEGSLDATTWTSVLDQTASTNAVAAQTYPLSAGPSARYVRITTTTLPTTSIWASFFEFQVYGH